MTLYTIKPLAWVEKHDPGAPSWWESESPFGDFQVIPYTSSPGVFWQFVGDVPNCDGRADTIEAAKAAAEAWYRAKMGEGLEPQAAPTPTPITAEGLRGLGLTEEPQAHGCKARIDLYSNDDEAIWIQLIVFQWAAAGGWFATVIKQDGDDDAIDNFTEVCIGHPTDLETVSDLIDVLRRMNGGG